MRKRSSIAVALAIALAASGCGSDAASTSATTTVRAQTTIAAPVDTATPAETAPTTASTEATGSTDVATDVSGPDTSAVETAPASHLVVHARGETEVVGDPQRVVALDPFSVQSLYDLGVEPIGVQSGLETVIAPEYAALYEAAAHVGTFAAPNVEMIATLEPDLILLSTSQWDEGGEVVATLAERFPVVVVPAARSNEWPNAVPIVADAMSLADRFEALKARYEAKLNEVRADHAEQLSTMRWALVWLGGDGTFNLRGPTSNSGLVLAAAGVQFIAAAPTDTTDETLSFEQLGVLDQADVIALPATTDGTLDEGAQAIVEQPLYAQLPAVQAGSVAMLTRFLPGSYGNSIALLDELVAFLASR